MKGNLKREVLLLALAPARLLVLAVLLSKRWPAVNLLENKIDFEKATVQPAAGQKWGFGRGVVTFTEARIILPPQDWKEYGRVDVYFWFNCWNIWDQPSQWRVEETKIMDSRGNSVPGALDIAGPSPIDRMGLNQRYVLYYWVRLPKSYTPKGTLIFKSKISKGSGPTVPITATLKPA